MKSLKRILYLINKKEKLFYLLASLSTFASVVFSLVTSLFISFYIDSVLSKNPTEQYKDTFINLSKYISIESIKDNLYIPAIIVISLAFGTAIFAFATERLASTVSETVAKKLKDNLYNHIQKLPYKYLNNVQTGDLLQRSTSDVETIRKFLNSKFTEMFKIICLIIVSVSIMININKKLTFLSFLVTPLVFLFSFRFFKKIKSTFMKTDIKEGELSTVLQENLTGVRVVKAFGRQKYEIDKFEEKNSEFRVLVFEVIKVLAEFWSISDLLCFSQIALIMVTSLIMAYNGEISIGTVILFYTYEQMLIWPIRNLGRLLGDFGKTEVSLERVYEILNTKEEEDIGQKLKPSLKGDIVFSNVNFSYSEGETILNDVSFKIKNGQTVAILGSTGSGKSTLMHILLRLYDYSKGSIKINNIELRDIEKTYLRSRIGLVLQDPFLFSKTIEENIRLAKYDATVEEVFSATKTAAVHDVIENFEKGYKTEVGERGVTLSGGQKQRLAIARTLIRDSDILIFDDSLSAVDTETDQQIRFALKNKSKEITTLIISQRVTTLKDADQIVVLENGKVSDIGTHEELLSKDCLYSRIWKIQMMLEDDFDKEVM